MVTYDDFYPSEFFKAADVEPGPIDLTAKMIVQKPMKDGRLKPVLYFDEDKRGLILNKTNANMLKLLTRSNNPADVTGLIVQLFAASSAYQGQPCNAVRIRKQPAIEAKPVSKAGKRKPPNTDDDVGGDGTSY